MKLNKYYPTARLCATQALDGGVLQVISGYIIGFLKFFVLVLIWRSMAKEGVDLGEFTLSQLLTYTLLSTAFYYQFTVVTPATTALWEGSIINRYTRPVPVLKNFMAETIGRWAPGLVLFTLPVFVLAGAMGVNILPKNLACGILFLVSFILSISLGFAIDFLFAAFALKLKNGSWLAMNIRESVFSLMSGGLIPLALLPFGLDVILGLLPFGSVASAPLMIYLGLGKPYMLAVQLFWNIVLWTAAVKAFDKAQEDLVSFGS